ncbi:ATP-binding cassette domain-containing protein [Actinomycetaceae bacterium TAE3-ERU4]|nr:ATP-binding cassette domain-containing protein [Actinomycetaceae bacterium TAE3-ERU4]
MRTTNETSRPPAVRLSGVSKIYGARSGQVHALKGIDLEIPAGQIHGIVGQSGAGKSTLIRCLTGLEQPTSGQLEVAGQSMVDQSEKSLRKARAGIGMVFQHANLLDSRTVEQNIAYPLKLAGKPRSEIRSRVAELIETVGLQGREYAYPSELSGGQRQRVGIARALANHPQLILCDEPTSALDTETTRQILELLRQLRDRLQVTIVIITHEMSVVREICDGVSLLAEGRIVESGPITKVVADFSGQLSNDLVPFPLVDSTHLNLGKDTLLDVRFTSNPGKPTGSAVLGKISEFGADVAAGTFETIDDTQIGRLAVTVDRRSLGAVITALSEQGINVQEVKL